MTLTRRAVPAYTASYAAAAPIVASAQEAPAIHAPKEPNCGCCTA